MFQFGAAKERGAVMQAPCKPVAAGPYVANLYPVTTSTPPSQPTLGVCFSGGGSRALSCALGQLSALTQMAGSVNLSQTIMDRVAYLSSVSGGSWAAVLYTFLPSGVKDSEFLITPKTPSALYKGSSTDSNPANVSYLGPSCLGTVPQQFTVAKVSQYLYTLYEWGFFSPLASSRWPWFWIAGVGELVLKPFGLYDATYDPNVEYIQPCKFFSLSRDYVTSHIQNLNPSLGPEEFYLCAPGRPTLIVNANVLQNYQSSNSAQVPVQALATFTSVPGQSPDGKIVGGGGVESFAFTSTLNG